MHVVFFNRSFYPDTTATGQLLTELCEGLVSEHGCRVSVVTGQSLLPSNSDPLPCEADRSSLLVRWEELNGIQILRARGTRFSKKSFAGRFSNYVTYFLSACWAGLRVERPDVVVALTDPPIIGLAAWLAAKRFRVPFVMAYKDIFPEVARLLEDFQSETVEWVLQRVNCFLAKSADRVLSLGSTMTARLVEGKGADPKKVEVIPDWIDCEEVHPFPKSNAFSAEHGLDQVFVVMHSGNIGLSQGLEDVIGAAAFLQASENIRMVFVGEGVKKPRLQELAAQRQLHNVRFLPFAPKDRLIESFASADVFVVSLKEGLSGYIVPSKLYGILAAGRPYVAVVEGDCEAAQIAREYDCGIVVERCGGGERQTEAGGAGATIETGSAPLERRIAESVLELYRNRKVREQMGENARKASLNFDRKRVVEQYHQAFSSLAE